MSERPEDVDAAFAAIVADLGREGLGADIQTDNERTESLPHPAKAEEQQPRQAEEPKAATSPEPAPASWRGHDTEWDWTWSGNDEGHYVPPEPPPLPRLRPATIIALVLVVVGVVLLVAPGIIGLDPRIGTPISLLTLVCGFGLLFLRIRRTPPDTDDNGAQV